MRFPGDPDRPWTDTMQVCQNGHLITAFAESEPSERKPRCPQCGSMTLLACPKCQHHIPGKKHYPGVLSLTIPEPQEFCENCGAPYPWTKVSSPARADQKKGTEMNTPQLEVPVAPDPKKVFIIHGRNKDAKVAIEHFLKALKLEPIDFDELAADLGGTPFVGDIVRAGMERARGIIGLFTPDEFSALRPDFRQKNDNKVDIQRWQARPNVIFEAGMAYGMAPDNTILVTLGSEVSLFSDVSGIHILRLDNTPASRGSFRQKLIGIKCDVDQRTNAWTDPSRSGDFERCVARQRQPRDPFRN